MNDVAEFARSRPNVNYRHFFKPSEELGGWRQAFDVRNETTWRFQEIGRADAKAALESALEAPEQAPEHSFAKVMEAHFNHVNEQLSHLAAFFTQE